MPSAVVAAMKIRTRTIPRYFTASSDYVCLNVGGLCSTDPCSDIIISSNDPVEGENVYYSEIE